MDVTELFDRLASHAASLGVFDRVNTHEPLNAPGYGNTAAVWANAIAPVRSSGLDTTSVRVEFMVRIYSHTQTEPPDAIDPTMLSATDTLMAAYTGDFTLGGVVREVDLLGQFGTGLSALAGYVNIGGTMGGSLMRVMTITVPLIVDDVWEQEE